MISHTLLKDDGILLVSPKAPLEVSDFQELAGEVDPYIEEHGALPGIMVEAERFPGWRNFSALKSHLGFVRHHLGKIKRIAAVSDNKLLSLFPRTISYFVKPELRYFDRANRESALAWLRAK